MHSCHHAHSGGYWKTKAPGGRGGAGGEEEAGRPSGDIGQWKSEHADFENISSLQY